MASQEYWKNRETEAKKHNIQRNMQVIRNMERDS